MKIIGTMRRTAGILLLLGSATVWGQTPRGFADLLNQAPPHVDQALRERVHGFYRLQQEKKWRLADQFVHAGSKDAFFEGDKLAFRGFKPVSVVYEENFTHARAVVDIDMDIYMAGFGQLQVHRPLVSSWKLEDGQWWWYTAQVDHATPLLPPGAPGAGPGAPGSLENFPLAMAELQNMVTVDRTELQFPSHQPATGEIRVTNRWENTVHLEIDAPELPGLTFTIDQPALAAGAEARIKVVSTPETRGAKPPVQVRLTVQELSKTVPIGIVFLVQ